MGVCGCTGFCWHFDGPRGHVQPVERNDRPLPIQQQLWNGRRHAPDGDAGICRLFAVAAVYRADGRLVRVVPGLLPACGGPRRMERFAAKHVIRFAQSNQQRGVEGRRHLCAATVDPRLPAARTSRRTADQQRHMGFGDGLLLVHSHRPGGGVSSLVLDTLGILETHGRRRGGPDQPESSIYVWWVVFSFVGWSANGL